MRILALDTASGCASVAVGEGETLLAEILFGRRETHSRHLMSLVDQALQIAGLTLRQIDGFGITQGPGSFTGLRIGISTLKGLAVVTQKPVVGVSSLAALATQCFPAEGFVCPMLDARNQEVYCARYQFRGDRLEERAPERSAAPEAAISELDAPCLFVGDGAIRYRRLLTDMLGDKATFALPSQHVIHAGTIWQLSRSKFAAGLATGPADLTPRYLRQSYAKPPKKMS